MKAELCKLADVPTEGVKPIDFFGRPAFAYRIDGAPAAVLAVCPHLGGPLEWKAGAFVCSWHGARFDAVGGRCTRWPKESDAPVNHAMRLPTRSEGDALFYVWAE
jgi:nitrite reductase/ring-hydroxylating ferredoxin subunit